MRILIADDHGIVRSGLRLLLDRQPDMEVVAEASDGAEAVEVTLRERPDLCILDVMMPKRNGFEVAREIRRRESLDRMPLILLTARSQEADVELGFAAGVDDYVAKPFSPREMLSRIEAVLARSEARA